MRIKLFLNLVHLTLYPTWPDTCTLETLMAATNAALDTAKLWKTIRRRTKSRVVMSETS